MSTIKDCPSCGLINPETATVCDCGYNFKDKTKGKGILSEKEEREALVEKRIIAHIIDSVVSGLLLLPVVYFGDQGSLHQTFILVFTVIDSAGFLIRDGIYNGQGLGKYFMGIKVIDEKTGENCSLLQSFERNILLVLVPFVFFIAAVQVLRGKRRIGETLSGTRVVRAGVR